MLDQAVQGSASTLLASASTDRDCDPGRIHEDMRWLAHQTADRGLRVVYEGMACSTVNCTLASAWGLVHRLAELNLGLGVDAHLFMQRGRADDLEPPLEPERVYLVQLTLITGSTWSTSSRRLTTTGCCPAMGTSHARAGDVSHSDHPPCFAARCTVGGDCLVKVSGMYLACDFRT